MNILLLGEIGVGKSTWINAFINILSYKSLQEAEKGELCTTIPSQFTICNENYQNVTVCTTPTSQNDSKKNFKPGQSATQHTTIYTINIGSKTVRLIDTPGFGDTRGVMQDKLTTENILTTLSNLEDIHGICVFLKPNSSRLNVMFRFYFNELLTLLPKKARDNIIFCFTNCRGTYYRPGNSIPVLTYLLQDNNQVGVPVTEENVYCFDSEVYRYLAAVKNSPPVQFSMNDKRNFAESWRKSSTEMERMLKHVQTLKPLKTEHILELNTAREIVTKMEKVVAEGIGNYQIMGEVTGPNEEEEDVNSSDFMRVKQVAYEFARFVKNNAIIPYNDAAAEYLSLLVGEEEDKSDEVVENGGDVLKSIQITREFFNAQKVILEEEENNADTLRMYQKEIEFKQLMTSLKQLNLEGFNWHNTVPLKSSSSKGGPEVVISPVICNMGVYYVFNKRPSLHKRIRAALRAK